MVYILLKEKKFANSGSFRKLTETLRGPYYTDATADTRMLLIAIPTT